MTGEQAFRAAFVAILAVTILVSLFHRRRAHRVGVPIPRGAEEPGLVAARLAIALPLWGLVLLYAAYPPAVGWARVELPPAVRWLGVGAAAATIPFTVWVFRSLGASVSETILTREGQTLITHGPYRWIRHPLYTGGLALLGSLSVVAANWAMAGMVLVAAAAVPVLARREEANLVERFGSEYEAYVEETGRFVPRIGRRRGSRSSGGTRPG